MKKLLSLIAVGLAAAGAVSQAAQVDSFDNLGTLGWHAQNEPTLMFPDTITIKEGTGAMRVDFTATSSWDNWVTSMDFWAPNQLNWSAYATLSFWTKVSDLAGKERIDQITLWDLGGVATRYNAPAPTTTDWTKIIAPFSAFTPEGAFDISQVKAIQIKFTTWDTHAPGTSSVWLDDMQVAAVPEPSALALLGLGLGSLLVCRRKQS